jgi:hypothetical protein
MHQKYIDQGETLYTGKVDSVEVFPGNERVKFSWMINSDPRINRIVIYWNKYKESATVDVNRTQPGIMKMETIVNVPEGIYEFILVTMDKDDNRSLGVNKTVQIFGPRYISNLNNRNVKSATFKGGVLTVNWTPVESESVQYTTVTFSDHSSTGSPVQNTVRVENSATQTVIPNVQSGDNFTVITTFLPEGYLDLMDALPQEYIVPE